MKPSNEFLEKVSRYNTENEISKGLIADLVERIEFDDNKNITVKMKYRDTVSYTHPRAPETVLDLVCRLLLEKKKHHCQPLHCALSRTAWEDEG